MQADLLLPLLADGEFHSGAELGSALGISRAAVWKQLQKLHQETGLTVEPAKGRGYRIPGGVDLLDRHRILEGLDPVARGLIRRFDLLGQTDSTNARAMADAQQGPAGGTVIVAEHQLAGRGRRGRRWVNSFGRDLCCSVVWQFEGGAAALEGLSLAVGVALVEGLERYGVTGLGLKWPNDLVWRRQKLGGILMELTGDVSGPCQVVVGFGVNVSLESVDATAIEQPWIGVEAIIGGRVSRNALLAAMLSRLLPLLNHFEQRGFKGCRAEWQKLDVMAGEAVQVAAGNQCVHGTAIGVNDQGALLVEGPAGVEAFYGGEVSLRLAK